MKLLRLVIMLLVLLLLWQGLIIVFHLPFYILPTPVAVFKVWWQQAPLIIAEAIPTVIETLLGFFIGALFAMTTAIAMAVLQPLRLWLLPIVVMSQAIPTFAIAPLLVIWFGYGMTSKIVTAILMLFFPITSAFFDGLRRTHTGFIELGQVMGSNRWRTLFYIRIPEALPSLATGLRVAAAIAPIGAIIGEWVGASTGLGFLMLDANARMQTDLMFAALFTIMILSLLFYYGVDYALRKTISWQQVTS